MGQIKGIAVNIKTIRKRVGFAQEKLAEKAGLSVNAIKTIETKVHTPSVDTLIKIAKALGTTVEGLIEGPKDPLVRHKELADTLYGKPKENVSKPFQVNPVNTTEVESKSDALLNSLSIGAELVSHFLSLPRPRQEAILSWRQHPKWIQFIRAINDNFYSFGGECEILCN